MRASVSPRPLCPEPWLQRNHPNWTSRLISCQVMNYAVMPGLSTVLMPSAPLSSTCSWLLERWAELAEELGKHSKQIKGVNRSCAVASHRGGRRAPAALLAASGTGISPSSARLATRLGLGAGRGLGACGSRLPRSECWWAGQRGREEGKQIQASGAGGSWELGRDAFAGRGWRRPTEEE